MPRIYKKTHAPSWQRKLVILVSAFLGATFLLFAVWAIMLFADRSRGDDCLDRGGTYDYERGQCDRESNSKTGSF
jgi:hypothetical protein